MVVEAAREAVSEGYADVTAGLIRRQEWTGALRLVRQGRDGAPRRTPLDIARERYAKGEITKEEFEEMKRHLADRGG